VRVVDPEQCGDVEQALHLIAAGIWFVSIALLPAD